MDKLSTKVSSIALVMGLLVTGTSLARGKVVFDPSNFGKNTVTARQQVLQTAHQAAIEAEEIRQYQMMVRDLKQLNPSVISQGINRGYIPAGQYASPQDVANAAAGVYSSYKQVDSTMSSMDAVYQGMDILMKDIDRTSIKSKVSPTRILQYDFQRAQKGIDQDRNYYKNLKTLNNQLEQHQRRADHLSKVIPSQNGTVGLLQVVSSQNTLLQDQMTHLIQVSSMSTEKAVQSSLDAQEKKEREAREKAEAINTEKSAAKYFTNKK